AVSWQAQVYTAVQDAAFVQRLYQLSYTGYDYYNLNGLGEKWLWSGTFGGLAVCILPDGSVRHYDPAGTAAMLSDADLLGRVDPVYYYSPLAMTSLGASAGGANTAGSVSISGSQLTVTPAASFSGPLYVVVTATDATATA